MTQLAKHPSDDQNYRPQYVTQAFKVYAGGMLNPAKGGNKVEMVRSPIENAADTVFIHVTDLRRSAEWYSMLMELPLLEERLNGGNVYWLMLEGGTGINLDDNRNTSPDTPRVRFMYKTDDIDEAYRYLEQKGIATLTPIERYPWGLSYFRFTDPDGNGLMVTQSDYVSEVVERLPDTESPILNKFGGIFLNVSDIARATRFHYDVLGLPVPDNKGQEDESIHVLPTSRGTQILLDNNRYRNGEDYEALFMLLTLDVEAAKAYLAKNGVDIFTDIERHGELAFFTVKDPDDNVIMICNIVD
ncbi:VOC family protein [Cohnella yongneupensis]|uniref:VOC family protein n=1 Tax=Cohnella yongneupensis TaxID=425006 RepID=A0ABW0R141_9BACL